jgi:RNA polymerase sigma-70 factor (ECF subfamily)
MICAQEFEEIYHKYKQSLYRIAYTYVRNESDAEDILQDVFTTRLYYKKAFESEEHEKRWLIRVTVNTSKNYLNVFWRKKKVYMEDLESMAIGQNNIETKEVLEAVLSLPQKCKAPMYLHYYEGYTCKEIGEILGCKESTIKMRLKKGRELLKFDLEKEAFSWN